MTKQDWYQLTTLLILVTALPVVGFVINYFFRFPWYKNVGGWNLLVFMAVVAEFLSVLLWSRIEHHRVPEYIQAVLWMQFAPVAWWRLFILVNVEIRQRRRQREFSREYIVGQTPDGGSFNTPISGE